MSEINMKGNRNKVVVNSTVAIVAVLIAIVAIVWIMRPHDNVDKTITNPTEAVTEGAINENEGIVIGGNVGDGNTIAIYDSNDE
ncbi:MAG: hypothetical protein IJ265_05290 [Oscillospiraceae bacterium]|nr:hypothetical protein [Oscillospiraceae bacterium]